MARRLYDFKCVTGHTTEKLIDVGINIIPCPICGSDARRQISALNIPLGVLGPNWVADRKAKQKKSLEVNQ